jgi:hypothetical protein
MQNEAIIAGLTQRKSDPILEPSLVSKGAVMKFALAIFAVAGFPLVRPTIAQGCGDKLVSLLGGVRQQRAYIAWKKASVIVFSNHRSSGAALIKRNLRATLKEAGHSVLVAQDSIELDQALKAGKVDVVLVDFADVGVIAHALELASDKPIIVPVLYRPSNADLAAAQQQNPLALKDSAKETQFLGRIEDAMKLRAKH